MSKPVLPDHLFAGDYGPERRRMIERDLAGRDIADPRVLAAMARLPRHRFVEPALAHSAYADMPINIGYGQTISQPYIVAKMTELARVGQGSRVLEIGAGSGYQTAVLLELGARVLAIEIVPELASSAAARLQTLGYDNYQLLAADGFGGLPDEAPFDAIIMAAAPLNLPHALPGQLAAGGHLVCPVGPLENQHLFVYTRDEHGALHQAEIFPVRFVPMTGQAGGASHSDTTISVKNDA